MRSRSAPGARRLYVLPTGHACALERPPGGALAMGLHAISILTQRRLIDDIERHRGSAELIVLPPPCPLETEPIDFDHADELIARSLAGARRFLDEGGEDRPAIRMRIHRHESAGKTRRDADADRVWNTAHSIGTSRSRA